MNKHPNTSLERTVYGFILFMISPAVAVYAAIRNFNFKESRLLIIGFFAVFGMTMIVLDGKDASTHQQNFLDSYVDKDLETFLYESKNLLLLRPNLNEGATNDDIYLHLISFVAGSISSNPAILFFIASLIYSIFFVRAMGLVYEKIKGKWNFVFIVLLFLFVIWKSFDGINSIRNWTGAWIFFNGAFSYFDTQKKKYLLWVVAAPMVHFAYLLITIPFFVVAFLGNRPKLYVALLAVSFFISLENIDIIKQYLILTDLGEQKLSYIDQGVSENYLLEGKQQAFHAKYYRLAAKLALSVLFYYAILSFGYLKKQFHSRLMLNLASMGVLMIAFSNLVSFSVTINRRIFVNAGMYALAYLLIAYRHRLALPKSSAYHNFNLLTYACMPLILLFAFTTFSNIGDFMNGKIFISPLTYWMFEGDYSIKELLRELIS